MSPQRDITQTQRQHGNLFSWNWNPDSLKLTSIILSRCSHTSFVQKHDCKSVFLVEIKHGAEPESRPAWREKKEQLVLLRSFLIYCENRTSLFSLIECWQDAAQPSLIWRSTKRLFWLKSLLIEDASCCGDCVRSDECYLRRGVKVWHVWCCGLVWPSGRPAWRNICFPSRAVTSADERDAFPSPLSSDFLLPSLRSFLPRLSATSLLHRNNESLFRLLVSECFFLALFGSHMASVLFRGNCNYNLLVFVSYHPLPETTMMTGAVWELLG